MSGRPAAVLMALLVGLAATALAAPAAAATVDVTVESVTASIVEPAPDEAFTVTTTVANGQSSDSPVRVTEVTVRDPDTNRVYGRVADAGNVSVGDTLEVPVVTSIGRAGTHQLSVVVEVEDRHGEDHRVRHAFVITVTEPDEAQLSFQTDDLVAGDPQPVAVTVANGDTRAISNVRLVLAGDVTIANPERVVASLPAGTAATETFDVTFPESGTASLRARVTYTTADGSTRTAERSLEVDVATAVVEPVLDVELTSTNGSTALRVELEQFGNVPLRDITVRVGANGTPLAQAQLPDVSAEGAAVAMMDATEFPPGEFAVTAAYSAAGEERRITRTRTLTSDVALTVSTAVVDGAPVLEAELTQFGQAELRDVELSVVDAGDTVARRPVGNLLGGTSRSATFGPDAVPAGELTVVATYTVGAERRTVESAVRYAPAPTASIAITGLEVTRSGGVVTLRGDAANIGLRGVSSVVLSVVPTEDVRPLNPNKVYFVGAVDASEFATFELTANVSAGVEAIPVRVEYAVDGEQVSSVRSIDVTDAEPAAPGSSGGSVPVVPLVIGLALLLAVGLGIWRWRQG